MQHVAETRAKKGSPEILATAVVRAIWAATAGWEHGVCMLTPCALHAVKQLCNRAQSILTVFSSLEL